LEVDIKGKKNLFFFNLYGMLSDSPGKAMLLNMVQFNGYFGCPYCLNPGKLKYFIKYFISNVY
jgi:hypothetical protein